MKIMEVLPWQELVEDCRQQEYPWTDGAADLMYRLGELELEDSGMETPLTEEALGEVSAVFDSMYKRTEKLDYYLRLSVRFCLFRNIVGVFLRRIACTGGEGGKRCLMWIAQAVMVSGIRQVPFSLKLWYGLLPTLDLKYQEDYRILLGHVERSLMQLAGSSVYRFFCQQCSRHEVDALLEKCHAAVLEAEQRRRYTGKRGQGHTRLVIEHILLWQERGVMLHLDQVMPFLKCLEALWHHDVRLGCRQGAERMYRKKTISSFMSFH